MGAKYGKVSLERVAGGLKVTFEVFEITDFGSQDAASIRRSTVAFRERRKPRSPTFRPSRRCSISTSPIDLLIHSAALGSLMRRKILVRGWDNIASASRP